MSDTELNAMPDSLRIHLRRRAPWEGLTAEEVSDPFARYVGKRSGDEFLLPWELATLTALLKFEGAARFNDSLVLLYQKLGPLAPSNKEAGAEGVMLELQKRIARLREADQLVDPNVPPELFPHFTLSSTACVTVFGTDYENAHLAAQSLLTDIVDAFTSIQGCEARTNLPVTKLAQLRAFCEFLSDTPFASLLQQIAREHRTLVAKVREGRSQYTSTSAPVRQCWSPGFSKKVLADFFGTTERNLERYLENAGIGVKPENRQSFMIDLNSLHSERLRRFRQLIDSKPTTPRRTPTRKSQ